MVFVLDTSGSMGDEVRFIKENIDFILKTIRNSTAYNDTRLGFAAYKDYSDGDKLL